VRWRNEIDIMAIQRILEVEHVFSKGTAICLIGFLSLPVLAYLMVLAINTAQVAVTKEYCPRPPAAGENRFLSVVVAERSDYRPVA